MVGDNLNDHKKEQIVGAGGLKFESSLYNWLLLQRIATGATVTNRMPGCAGINKYACRLSNYEQAPFESLKLSISRPSFEI